MKNMNTPNFTAIDYAPPPAAPGDSAVVYSDMVHGFLSLVQSNPFPPDFLITLIQSKFRNYDTPAIIRYESGYLACAVLGFLFIVVMPLTGLIICVYRCFYKRCGGEMHQTIKRRMKCKRSFYFFSVFALTIIILVGNIAMFVSNSDVSFGLVTVFRYFNDTVNNVDLYLKSIYKEFSIVINASNRTVSFANESLHDIGQHLGGRILADVGIRANPEINLLLSLCDSMHSAKVLFKTVNDSYNEVHALQVPLMQQLGSIRQRVYEIISSPLCSGCTITPTSDLEFNANFDMLPDFSKQYNALHEMEMSDFPSSIRKGNATLNSIPQQVTNKSRATVQATIKQLVDFRNGVQKIQKELSFTKHLTNVTDSVQDFSVSFYKQQSKLERYDYIRWSLCFVLSCMVLLIIFCMGLGLLLGPFGLEIDDDPVKRGCLANTGGNFLMAGAGLSFVFSWLLMGAVIVLFFVGGNVYTLICKPWKSGEMFKLIDTPGLIEGFNLSELMGIPNRTLTVASIYSQCKENRALWAALNLDDRVQLEKHLNFSKFEEKIIESFNSMNITLEQIQFYSEDQKYILWDILNSAVKEVNFEYIVTQLGKPLLRIDLLNYASKLKALASANKDPGIKANLTRQADRLIDVDSEIKSTFLPAANTLRHNIVELKKETTKADTILSIVVSGAEDITDFLVLDVPPIITKGTDHFRDSILNFCHSYVKWAITTMRTKVATCEPVSYAADAVFTMFCEYVVDTLNHFWFSLGWCTAFLIPSVILTVRLAKYYRRMESANVAIEADDDDLELELGTSPKRALIYKINLDAGSSKTAPWSRPIFIQG